MAKHCHFSILYNELPFLKQKLPFLYKNFDQLIFYDLNIHTKKFSNDGSHEYIKNFPDPDNKITLIEETNLNKVKNYKGVSFKEKRQMFALGSLHVKDDIDFFWCTDMDEFFEPELIKEIEKDTRHNSFVLKHLIFFKNDKFVFSENKKDGDLSLTIAARIARHKPGNIYGHCTINRDYTPVKKFDNSYYYSHFAYVGDDRVLFKCRVYKLNGYMNFWNSFKESNIKNGVHYIGKAHPVIFNLGISKNKRKIPYYIDVKKLMKDLKV